MNKVMLFDSTCLQDSLKTMQVYCYRFASDSVILVSAKIFKQCKTALHAVTNTALVLAKLL